MLKETVTFTLIGHSKEELVLSVETHMHLFGKTRVAVEYAGAAKPRDFAWPDEALTYINELMDKWEGAPIDGLDVLYSELERLDACSRELWQMELAIARYGRPVVVEVR